MKTLTSILMTVALVCALSAPALADGSQQGTVTVTFKLTVYGNVPRNQYFFVTYASPEQVQTAPKDNQGEPQLPTIQFCGPGKAPGVTMTVSTEQCKGNGAVYTGTAQYPSGTHIFFRYFTSRPPDINGTFDQFYASFRGERPRGLQDTVALNTDTTLAGWYRFGSTPSRMPATGAGGVSRQRAPGASLAALLLILAGGGYGLRRAWRTR